MNNRIIAEALLDIAKKSTTTIIDVDSDFDLIEAAAKLNIQLPSPDLAVIKTVYAETDKPNRNGVMLPKEAVKIGLPTIIGKQINWEHDGAGRICGYIIDACLNKDLIEITGVIFKSLFPEEMDEVKAKFEKGELTVSFEIWNKEPKTGKSVVHDLDDGSRSIDPIIFHGCGLLLAHAPACPKAKVYKLVAKVNDVEAKKFSKDLVYASQAIDENNINEEETKVEEIIKEEAAIETPKVETPAVEVAAKEIVEEKKEIASEEPKVEEKPAETKTEEKSEVAETKAEEAKTEDKPVETKVEEKPVEAKVEEKPAETPAEEKPVEAKAEEAKEVKEEEKKEEVAAASEAVSPAKLVKEVRIESTISTFIPDENGNGNLSGTQGMRKIVRSYSDGREEINEEAFEVVQRYTLAELDEKVAAAKAEKDAEIATVKAELENTKQELGKKDQEIAALTVKEESTPKDKILEVGSVETKDRYLGIQQQVNEKAFGKK